MRECSQNSSLLVVCALLSLFACFAASVVCYCSHAVRMDRDWETTTAHYTSTCRLVHCGLQYAWWYTLAHTLSFDFHQAPTSHTKFSPGRWKTCFQIRAIKTPQNQIPQQQTRHTLGLQSLTHSPTHTNTHSFTHSPILSHLVIPQKKRIEKRNSLRSDIYA